MSMQSDTWRLCSSCKKSLVYGRVYFACSVSTCSKSRTALSFCSVACWDAHLPFARHREAWAVEERAPSREAWARQQVDQERSEPVVRPAPAVRAPAPAVRAPVPDRAPAAPVRQAPNSSADVPVGPLLLSDEFDEDILIVVSKLKKFVKDRAGMNTSDSVMEMLSEHLRFVCDEAIRSAHQDGRKTVMDRDVRPVTSRWRIVR
jgi:hypothetical protein